MSHQLPPQPNLEHLRKQAKDLAREAQRRHPAFTLSDAQHELAKKYGFASWPKLKAHVEQMSSPTLATQNGAVVGRGRYEVTEDRKTLIVTGDEQRIVLDRR
jgi:Glyoxalase superfamily protein